MSDEPERLEAILGALSIGDALWLSERLEPAWRARKRRLDARAEALAHAAETLFPGSARTTAAKKLARALHAYITDGWKNDRAGQPVEPKRAALWTIASLQGGRPLSWRTIAEELQNSPIVSATVFVVHHDHEAEESD
jgi:hypothetical protein